MMDGVKKLLAGEALSREEFEYSKTLGTGTEFLELASMRQFQDRFIDCLNFEEEED